MENPDPRQKYHRSCIIVGAGLSGLIQAAEIVRKGTLPLTEILILEKNEGLGGVWKQNSYPGAACDVKSHLYQISWHRNYEWSETFPRRDEILAYYQQFANQYQLPKITLFNTAVTSTVWDEEDLQWTVKTTHTTTQKSTDWTTDTLILATGIYSQPSIPTHIPGFPTYKGHIFHTSSWPSNLDLTGKCVVYIGTGPTAVQVIPQIQPLVKELTVIMRSVAYCIPRSNKAYSSLEIGIFRYVPWAAWLYSQFLALAMLAAAYAFRPTSLFARETEKMALGHLDKQVMDEGLRRMLQPYGRFGAKRPLLSDDFYLALQGGNVTVVNGGIAAFTEDGVRLNHSEHAAGDTTEELVCEQETEIQADVIILGTGFKMQCWGSSATVVGLKGEVMSQRLDSDPSALYGISVPQFPNCFIIQGPNSNMPWYSVPWTAEWQATYIAKLVGHVKQLSDQECRRIAIMATESAVSTYTEDIQDELKTLSTDQRFGKSAHYIDHKGRNTSFYPFMPWNYWWMLRRVDWGQFQFFRGHE